MNSQDFEGDKMFVDRKGNEMLADVKFRIHKSNCGGTELKAECPKCGKVDCKCDEAKKAECPTCGKKDCIGKGSCVAKKDDKKKPAHGMVIVIGSKAGPGPYKDGKREKLDSEKKDESD